MKKKNNTMKKIGEGIGNAWNWFRGAVKTCLLGLWICMVATCIVAMAAVLIPTAIIGSIGFNKNPFDVFLTMIRMLLSDAKQELTE